MYWYQINVYMYQYFNFTEKSPIIDEKEIQLSGYKKGKNMYIHCKYTFIHSLTTNKSKNRQVFFNKRQQLKETLCMQKKIYQNAKNNILMFRRIIYCLKIQIYTRLLGIYFIE